MPTNEEILGFSNTWYSEALKEAVEVVIDNDIKIRLVTGPYFCATKIEAFYGRGHDDIFLESISAQFNPDQVSQKRCDIIIERIQEMTL